MTDFPPTRPMPLRVHQTREQVVTATAFARQLLDEGRSVDDLRAAMEARVGNVELARALSDFALAERRPQPVRGNHEWAAGLYFAVLGLLIVVGFGEVATWLYGLVLGATRDVGPALFAAAAQALLLRLGWRILKASGISLTDTLNGATYPTTLHRPTLATAEEDRTRRRRIALLIADTVRRMAAGARFGNLYRELSRIELTPAATVWLLIQARLGLMIGVNFPPYTNRSRAYLVAAGAIVGCGLGLEIVSRRLAYPSQLYFLTTWAILFVAEILRPPRRVFAPEAA